MGKGKDKHLDNLRFENFVFVYKNWYVKSTSRALRPIWNVRGLIGSSDKQHLQTAQGLLLWSGNILTLCFKQKLTQWDRKKPDNT